MKKRLPVRERASVSEVLERVLDHGLVIDAWFQVSVAGLQLIDVDARIVVASIAGYVRHAHEVRRVAPVARPAFPDTTSVPVPPAIVDMRRDRAAKQPARRRRRPASRLTRLFRCDRGCTFTRPVDATGLTRDTLACPYRASRVCVLRTA